MDLPDLNRAYADERHALRLQRREEHVAAMEAFIRDEMQKLDLRQQEAIEHEETNKQQDRALQAREEKAQYWTAVGIGMLCIGLLCLVGSILIP